MDVDEICLLLSVIIILILMKYLDLKIPLLSGMLFCSPEFGHCFTEIQAQKCQTKAFNGGTSHQN